LSWDKAGSYCQSNYGGHLAIIRNDDEQREVASLLKKSNGQQQTRE